MRVTPRSEQQLQESNLIPAGIYPFEVIAANDSISKSGNEMIKLTLAVSDLQGTKRAMYDYLLDAMAYKVRHFCEHTGLLSKYETGSIEADDCINRSGHVEIIINAPQPNPAGGFYPSRNAIKDYCAKGNGKDKIADSVIESLFNDVPF